MSQLLQSAVAGRNGGDHNDREGGSVAAVFRDASLMNAILVLEVCRLDILCWLIVLPTGTFWCVLAEF